jgi:hypothetical protein
VDDADHESTSYPRTRLTSHATGARGYLPPRRGRRENLITSPRPGAVVRLLGGVAGFMPRAGALETERPEGPTSSRRGRRSCDRAQRQAFHAKQDVPGYARAYCSAASD